MKDEQELGLNLDSLALVEILIKITDVTKRYHHKYIPYHCQYMCVTVPCRPVFGRLPALSSGVKVALRICFPIFIRLRVLKGTVSREKLLN